MMKNKLVMKHTHTPIELTAIRFNDVEFNDRRQLIDKGLDVQTARTEIMLTDEHTSNSRDAMQDDVEINIDALHTLNRLPSNRNDEEIVDQTEVITVMENSGPASSNSMIRNHRIVDTVIEKPVLITTNDINNVRTVFGGIVGYAEEPLLPLFKACAPLNNIFHNMSFYIQIALNETPEVPPDGLTIDESAAIRLYTIEWEEPHESLYSLLNRTLKNGNREHLRPYFKYLKLFLTALVKLPCVPPLAIWRGVTKNVSAEFPPGTSVTWWSFSSCTVALTVLENNMYLGHTGNRSLFSVEAMNGRKITAHSHFATENEVLLLPGTQMIVQSKLSPADDLYIIHLKQIIPKEVLLEPPFKGALLYPKIERSWYRKKRFTFPICLLTILFIGAIIIGSVLGTRSKINQTKNVCINPYLRPNNYLTGNNPFSVAVGYFRNDIELDAIVANSGDNTINILLGTGNGTFQSHVIYLVGNSPYFVISGDFNDDTKLDLAVANYGDNTVSILVGNKDGTFETSMNYTVGNSPTSMTLGHFNNDTKLDLVVTNSANNTISVLLGNGNGTFQVQMNYLVGNTPVFVISDDFNNDNKLDLVVVNVDDNNISVLLGNGDGTFQSPVDYTVGNSPFSVTSGDFNNDTEVDLAVTNMDNNTISVLFGNGNGTFQTQSEYATGTQPRSIISGDYNNDRKLDLIVVNTGDITVSGSTVFGNTVSVLLGNGDGTFQTLINYPVGNSPSFVISGDFNNDTKLDLAVANSGDGTISILLGNSDGIFLPQYKYMTGTTPYSIVLGDFNNDTKLDLIVADVKENTVSVLIGNGDGVLQTQRTYSVGNSPSAVISGDFNKDTKLDVAVTNGGDNTVSVLFGNGRGTFQTPVSYMVGNSPSFIISNDFNDDTILDLAVVNSNDNTVSILLGNENGTFQTQSKYATGTQPTSVISGRFNNDNKLDLAVANFGGNIIRGTYVTGLLINGNVSVMLGNGDGTFQIAMNFTVGIWPHSVTSGYFNNDDKLDLAVVNTGDNTVSILLGNGDGTFQTSMNYTVGNYPSSVISGDFNNDTKLDLAVTNYGDNTVSLLLGNGNGIFNTQITYATDSRPTFLVFGDLSNNKKLDLIVVNRGSADLSVLQNICE